MYRPILFTLFILWATTAFSNDNKIAQKLQNAFIWAKGNETSVVFRKQVVIKNNFKQAHVYLFADSYYGLYINGRYILSGPSRFDPKWPEYDKIDIKAYLNKGKNTIAVLVYGGIVNGQRMMHNPGFTFCLNVDDLSVITDTSWKCSADTRFKPARSKWNGINEFIDATKENEDCLAPGIDDSKWQASILIPGTAWGGLHKRSIPLLSENEIFAKQNLPKTINDTIKINFERNYLLSVEMDIEAPAATIIKVGGLTYTTKAGRQKFRTFDSFGITDGLLQIKSSGPVTIHEIHFYNRIYPLKLSGSFLCSDTVLNRLWEMSMHTMQQITEDGYQDCAWERAEWMGDASTIEYPLTRVAFTGPGNTYGDPRLIRKILRDIAQSADADGRVKAHHPSSRFDIHAYIEDYACNWVQSLREYYQYTGDVAFVKEMWPVLKGQLSWFLKKRTESGLIKAREFIGTGNPLAYVTCEGASVNAFVYKAFQDGAYLGKIIGDKPAVALYRQSSKVLYKAFNTVLWNDSAKLFNASTAYKPTYISALLPLDRGIVDPVKAVWVNKWLMDNYDQASKSFSTSIFPWFLNYLYSLDTELWDSNAINVIKDKYKFMYGPNNKGFTVLEHFERKSRPFHDYGTVPAIFMCTHILGVTVNLPLTTKLIIIKPQLGYLTQARGTVVTEHGLVNVAWTQTSKALNFKFSIPPGAKARVYFPLKGKIPVLTINKMHIKYMADGRYAVTVLPGGSYNGTLE